jgi:hypothetical protein
MVSFIELEKKSPAGSPFVVPANTTLVFDTVVSRDGSLIDYDATSGVISFNEAGFFYVNWFVAPRFGLTTDGSNWAIQTSIGQMTFVGSSHTKVSVTVGFALINAESAGETARLINVSSGDITLSQAVQTKAGLIVYSLP